MNFLFTNPEEVETTSRSPLQSPTLTITSQEEEENLKDEEEIEKEFTLEQFYNILEYRIEQDTEEMQLLQKEWNHWSISVTNWKKFHPLYLKLGLGPNEALTEKRGMKIFSNITKKTETR